MSKITTHDGTVIEIPDPLHIPQITPDPWYYYPAHGLSGPYILDRNGEPVFRAFDSRGERLRVYGGARSIGNCLIAAAAPDMYWALRKYLAPIQKYGPGEQVLLVALASCLLYTSDAADE